MIPETSRELQLNLSDQSRLGSNRSLTCLTALNSLCVHKACMCRDSRTAVPTTPLPYLSLKGLARLLPTPTLHPPHLSTANCKNKTSFPSNFLPTSHARDPCADGGVCHPCILMSFSSLTRLLEDFPGFNRNRFCFSVCFHRDNM